MEKFINDFLNKISSIGQSVVRVRTESVINPLLWLAGIICPLSIIGFIVTENRDLLLFAATPIVIIAIAYLYFMLKNPDYLQSEEFQLGKKHLELMGEKGKEVPIAELEEIRALPKPKKTKRKK